MSQFNLNEEKTVNSLLYIVSKLDKADIHKVCKVLYFADQKHIVDYGRPITCDTYVKMQYGPVPSYTKNVIDGSIPNYKEVVAKYNEYYLKNVQECEIETLSESDIECLDYSIRKLAELNFSELTELSHDLAYNESNWTIDYLKIAQAGGADKNTLEYIHEQMQNENLVIA